MKLVAESPCGLTVEIQDEVVEKLIKYSQRRIRDKEGGGQIFAKSLGPNVDIPYVTSPRLTDRRWRYKFFPDRVAERREILEHYRNGLHYVGDWHTHPEEVPSPSREDIDSMQECFRRSKHSLNFFILMVVGTGPMPKAAYIAIVNETEVIPMVVQLH